MAVRLVYLGRLADLAGAREGEVAGPLDWAGLLRTLAPSLAESVRGDRVRLAVNGRVLPDKAALAVKDGDEIALLPPVSGG